MCGQTGLMLAPGRRNEEKLARLRDLFTRLLDLNEFRGTHATGVAMLDGTGRCDILKKPLPAGLFIKLNSFTRLMSFLSNDTTLLMGHTRFVTVGSPKKAENNHPNEAGSCLSTMNGTIYNADALFKMFRLPRAAEVDSELIARLADSHAPDGEILVKNFLHSLRLCKGQISAVVASFLDPEKVIILKGNKPLGLRYSAKYGAVVYSSDDLHLDVALQNDGAWKKLVLQPMTCAVFDIRNLPDFEKLPFAFKCEKRRGNYD